MSSEQSMEQPTVPVVPVKDPATAKAAVEQFDKEFQRYTTKQVGIGLRCHNREQQRWAHATGDG